jgi:EmrB/QacA subfamily drug resistance transporter
MSQAKRRLRKAAAEPFLVTGRGGSRLSENAQDNYKWRVLGSVIFGLFMVILDTTVVNVAFPTLRTEFGATLSASQWIISIYVLALGIATPMAGFFADRFGIKRTYVLGLTVFVTGSMLCGIAPNLRVLIAARMLQGLGGGLALPLGTAQLLRAFPPHEQGLALGVFGMALVVAPALGPILGGWLVDLGLWRAIFFINLPIGLTGVILASRFLRESRSETPPPWDWWGLVTCVIGFGSVLYAASIAADRGWASQDVLIAFGIGAFALGAFASVELSAAPYPLLDLRLFRNRTFLLAATLAYISVLALFGAEFLLPVYLQALRGLTAFHTGLVLLPFAITAGATTPLAGRIYDRVGPRVLAVLGFAALAVNTWQFSRLDATTPLRSIMMLLAVRGFALGMTVQTTQVTALSVVSKRDLPRGSSLINSTRQVVQAIGVALLASVVASSVSPEVRHFQTLAQEHAGAMSHPIGLCQVTDASAPEVARMSAQPLVRAACAENIRGFERAYRLTFYLALLAIVVGALLPGWPRGWAGRGGAAHATT